MNSLPATRCTVEQAITPSNEIHLAHGVVISNHRGPVVDALERVRQRLNAASSGNWAVMDVNDPGEGQNFIEVYSLADGLEVVCRLPDPANYSGREGLRADADFIANAPSDVEQLLDALDAGLAVADKAAALCRPGERPESGNPGMPSQLNGAGSSVRPSMSSSRGLPRNCRVSPL